jgi:tetraacyldisaccharide 4'-kinase
MKILLRPFSWLFRFLVFIRNKLYDYGYFKTVHLSARVISIGNIDSGGTGKTPFTEYLARYFLEKGKSVVILTKGYKRADDDMQVVELGYKNEENKLTNENMGDESMMILEDFMDEPSLKKGKGLLIVSDSKRSGVKLADSKFKPDLIILDDGFQHRRILRDVDIVLLNPVYKGPLIPSGTFREPFSSTKRADLKILNYKFKDIREYNIIKLGTIPTFNYVLDGFYNVKNEALDKTDFTAFAFCGIGDPDSFRDLLKNNEIKVADFLSFPDHHNFKEDEVKNLINRFRQSKADLILTTQKDFVRFKYSTRMLSGGKNSIKELMENCPVYYSKIRLNFTQNQDILINKLSEIIKD